MDWISLLVVVYFRKTKWHREVFNSNPGMQWIHSTLLIWFMNPVGHQGCFLSKAHGSVTEQSLSLLWKLMYRQCHGTWQFPKQHWLTNIGGTCWDQISSLLAVNDGAKSPSPEEMTRDKMSDNNLLCAAADRNNSILWHHVTWLQLQHAETNKGCCSVAKSSVTWLLSHVYHLP